MKILFPLTRFCSQVKDKCIDIHKRMAWGRTGVVELRVGDGFREGSTVRKMICHWMEGWTGRKGPSNPS
jgi:hypothetical protein